MVWRAGMYCILVLQRRDSSNFSQRRSCLTGSVRQNMSKWCFVQWLGTAPQKNGHFVVKHAVRWVKIWV